MILQGGDAIYDALARPKDAVEAQFEIFRSIYDDVPVPVIHVVGNHDCWGHADGSDGPLPGRAGGDRGGQHRASLNVYLTVSLPSMPPSRWPGTEQ